jgi:hypothetical protein
MSETKKVEIQQTLGRLNRDVSQALTGGTDIVSPETALVNARAEAKWLLAMLEQTRCRNEDS